MFSAVAECDEAANATPSLRDENAPSEYSGRLVSGPYWTATPARHPGETRHSAKGGAQSDPHALAAAADPLLAELLKQWHRLTPEGRERIAGLLQPGELR